METKKGIPVSPGIAFAPAVVIDAEDYRIPRRHLSRSEIKDELAHEAKYDVHVRCRELGERQKSTLAQIVDRSSHLNPVDSQTEWTTQSGD